MKPNQIEVVYWVLETRAQAMRDLESFVILGYIRNISINNSYAIILEKCPEGLTYQKTRDTCYIFTDNKCHVTSPIIWDEFYSIGADVSEIKYSDRARYN